MKGSQTSASMTLYSKVLLLSICVLCHSTCCQSSNSADHMDMGLESANISGSQIQDDSLYGSSQDVRYPSKGGLICLLAIRRRILHTYQPFFDNFSGKIALLDAAAHTNVGDNILWLAAKELVAHFGRLPTLLCAGDQWDSQQRFFLQCPDPETLLIKLGNPALVFWSAGGNFGDIWRTMQTYRNNYIRGLDNVMLTRPEMSDWNVTLVQLPQSIHYSDSANLAHDGNMFNSLSKLHFSIASRDPNGLALGQDKLKVPVFACPDLAFMLGPAQAVTEPSVDVLLLIRDDKEGGMSSTQVLNLAAKILGRNSMTYKVTDWPTGANEVTNHAQEMYTELADLRWQLGLRIISAGRILITNRLHATVIGALLGIPTFYYDSLAVAGYGKLQGTIHLARQSSEACTETALRSWHVTGNSEAESAEAAMKRAARYFRERSMSHVQRSVIV